MFYSTKLMNFWHKNLHFVHNPSKLFKKGAAPQIPAIFDIAPIPHHPVYAIAPTTKPAAAAAPATAPPIAPNIAPATIRPVELSFHCREMIAC